MPPLVLRGAAAVLVGSAAADVDRVRPVLQPLGELCHVGPLGSGARLNLVANSRLATVTTAAAELQVAGEATGLDPEQVFWILARLVPSLEMRRAGYVSGRHRPAQFALRALLNLPTRFPRANIRLVSYPQSSHRKSTWFSYLLRTGGL